MLVGDLTLLKCLGKGAFGEVYLTSKPGCPQKFATKKIDKKFAKNPRAKKYLDNEINILKEIDHPNIIKLIEVHQTTQYYYLVMELCNGGGLSECLEEHKKLYKKPFSEDIVQYLMKQIVDAINYLHKKNILHRDIKLDNILVNFETEEDKKNRNMKKATIKIIDFGFARHLSPGDLAKKGSSFSIRKLFDKNIFKSTNSIVNKRRDKLLLILIIIFSLMKYYFFFKSLPNNKIINFLYITSFILDIICIMFIFYPKIFWNKLSINKKRTVIEYSFENIFAQNDYNLDKIELLCPVCRIIKLNQSKIKHCIICNKCIDNWDHHCYWLNICINKDNYNLFLFFSIFLFLEITFDIFILSLEDCEFTLLLLIELSFILLISELFEFCKTVT